MLLTRVSIDELLLMELNHYLSCCEICLPGRCFDFRPILKNVAAGRFGRRLVRVPFREESGESEFYPTQ